MYFYIPVSGQLQLRTPFSRPEGPEGVLSQELPLYCSYVKEYWYIQFAYWFNFDSGFYKVGNYVAAINAFTAAIVLDGSIPSYPLSTVLYITLLRKCRSSTLFEQ